VPVSITALYAGIFGLVIVALGNNVTLHRFKYRVMLGDQDIPQLRRVVRMHGNAVENIPFALLLMGFYELDGGLAAPLHAAGIILIVGRILFILGLVLHHDAPSPVRATGVTVTWLTIAALGLLNLWQIR
jgi:uncharacterized protein